MKLPEKAILGRQNYRLLLMNYRTLGIDVIGQWGLRLALGNVIVD